MVYYSENQKIEKTATSEKGALNDVSQAVDGINVTDGVDFEPTAKVRGMKLDASGAVEYELAESSDGTTMRDNFVAGVIYPLYITKIYYTTGSKGNTGASLGITLYY